MIFLKVPSPQVLSALSIAKHICNYRATTDQGSENEQTSHLEETFRCDPILANAHLPSRGQRLISSPRSSWSQESGMVGE